MNAWIQGALLAGLSLGCLTSAAPAAERAAESAQSLGVVAVAARVPLTCAGADCTAELSTICLEEQRGAPAPGTSYRAVAVAPGGLAAGELVPGGLVLVGRRPDGTMARLPADGLVTVTAARTYAAVRVALP